MTLRNAPGPVLKNRGIPVSVHRLAQDGDGQVKRPFEIVLNGDEPVIDERFVRLTNLVLSDIEEKFGDLLSWQEELSTHPFKATVDTLAIAWDLDRRQAGAMLIDGTLDDYNTAIGASFMLANGSSVEDVGKVLVQGIKASKELRTELAQAVDQLLAEAQAETETTEIPDVIPGPPTSEDGSELVGASTSSGT